MAKKSANTSAKVTKRVATSPKAPGVKKADDWRAATLERVRALIIQALPDVVEDAKWKKPSNSMKGVPVWSSAGGGMICTGETYKDKVKLTFAKGAALDDPAGLFNAGLGGGTRRAIDLLKGDTLDAKAFKALVLAAAALNKSSKAASAKRGRSSATKPEDGARPKLLSGGNPQIPKADGDAPVQAYIAAMPGWKQDVGRALDDLITRAVPGVQKAVRWNSPFYGIEGGGWFLSYHCITKYVKVAFFRGASLKPLPPVESKQKDVRYFHIHEGEEIDEKLLKNWVRQAARLPGERCF